jgi:UDP-GlcNAc:undecaprenyl-phosphate GlcNAc-1-phosphate transferase
MLEHMDLILACLLAVICTVYFIKIFMPVSIRIGLVDAPGGRKEHHQETPLIGGVCIFLGLVAGFIVIPHSIMLYKALFAASVFIIIVGVLDDLHELTARKKFIFQILAALVVVLDNHFTIVNLGFTSPVPTLIGIPFSILCVIAFINSINMMDGEDGYAASTVLFELCFLFILAFNAQNPFSMHLILITASTIVGFLCFNFPTSKNFHAKIFMGDAGSMLLGLVVACLAIHVSQHSSLSKPANIIWFIGLPVLDMLRLFAFRILSKGRPFQSDRNHLHHLIRRSNQDKRLPILISFILTCLLGLIGLTLEMLDFSSLSSVILFILTLFIYSFVISWRFAWSSPSILPECPSSSP